MRYSLFVITNVASVRKKIEQIIKMHSDKFKLVGQADNSIVGKSMIGELMPQIILMQENMQFWDAAHLVRDFEEANMPVQCVLLCDDTSRWYSSVQEHRAVSAGIRELGFAEEDLVEALNKAAADWDQRHKNQNLQALTKLNSNYPQLTELVFGIDGNQNTTHFSDGVSQVLPYKANQLVWVACACPKDYKTKSFYQYYPKLPKLYKRLYDTLEAYGKSAVSLLHEQKLCILVNKDKKMAPDWNAVSLQINAVMDYLEMPEVTIDVLDEPVKMAAINEAYTDLDDLHRYRFFFGNVPVLRQSDIKLSEGDSTIGSYKAKIKDIIQDASALNDAQMKADMEELFNMVREARSFNDSSYVWNQLLFHYSSLVKTYMLPESEFSPNLLHSSFAQLSDYQEMAAELYTRLIRGIRRNKFSQNAPISKVMEYMDEHMDEALTLEEVAGTIHISATYLSKLFKKEAGTTFIKALTEMRIEKAKLLLQAQWKVTEVSPAVGFPNTKYFSQVFKKSTGLSPQQYKGAFREGRVSSESSRP